MRGALIRSINAAVLALALAMPGALGAAPPRPVVRIVLVTGGETPSWFDGFAKHLQSELALRGIDVAVARAMGEAGPASSGESSAAAVADAELVVDAPSTLRPVLRFSVAPGGSGPGDVGSGGHVRQVNLNRVPSDGRALALAVAADELMRSTWSRAVPADHGSSRTGADGAAGGNERGDDASEQGNAGDGQKDVAATPARQASAEPVEASSRDDANAAESGTRGKADRRISFGVAAAVEAFTAGQTQVGADARWSVRLFPRLELEVRGGYRSIVSRETTHGTIDGSAIVGGGALAFRIVEGARAALLVVGRADFLHASYTGQARDSTVDESPGSALGFVLGAGPRGRLLLTRSLALDAEVLAGASPMATTASDTGSAVVSTNGAAFMTSLGLSFGL